MRKTIIGGIVASLLGLLVPQTLPAQGTTYLSNLDQASIGSLAVGSNSWIGGMFTVGNYSGGYVLNSVELAMSNASGDPSGLQVMIYASNLGGPSPGVSLGTLTGSLDPVSAGIYTYTPSAPTTFLQNHVYAIVLTAGTGVADGAYEWNYEGTNFYNPSGGWRTPTGAWTSSTGLLPSWVLNANVFPQFAVEAIPVPEPGVLSLFVLGGLHLAWRLRKAKTV